MVYTVTLNPSVDYMIFPKSCEAGKIHRYEKAVYGPGGKGVNVALLLTDLGVRCKALGICGGFSGEEILSLLKKAGCETDFVRLSEGNSRINFKVCTSADGLETDFNCEGPQTPQSAVEDLLKKLSGLSRGDVLVLAGSVPPGVDQNIYAQILEGMERQGVQTVVDAAGEALLSCLPHHPFLVKPNGEELGELFGVEITTVALAKEYAQKLLAMGAQNVVVSLGELGALLAPSRGNILFSRTVAGETVSTVGAGDSLVAGFLYGLSLHGTLEGALRWGVAAGAATAFTKGIAGAGLVKSLYPQVGNPNPV